MSITAVLSGSTTFGVSIETKNSEEADGSATTAGSFSEVGSIGVQSTGLLTGLKELVRYRYNAKSGWVHFEMQDPQWLENEAGASANDVEADVTNASPSRQDPSFP